MQKKKFFWLNILAMFLTVVMLLIVLFVGLSVYTRHGQAVEVPDIKGMRVQEAEKILEHRNLICLVSDSTYNKDLPAGTILDFNPKAGQMVKEGHIIYLTVNTVHVPLQLVPDVADNSSIRQAQARLAAAGFKFEKAEFVSGERDWVYGVKYNGKLLKAGDRIPTGASLVLLIGDGGGEMLDIDSLVLGTDSAKAVRPESTEGESWF